MAKRKTVKDLNEEVEVLKDRMNKMERVANLLDILTSDNLKVLEKKVKLISIVRVGTTIVDIEKKVHENSECLKVLMMKKNEVADDTVPKDYSCKKCESIFHTKSKLRAHIRINHPKELKCQVCDETFVEMHKLELHLKNHDVESFQCKD